MLSDYERKLDKERFTREKAYILEHRNKLGKCPYCNGSIKDRKVSLYKGIIDTLYKVYEWLGKKKRHEFNIKEVRDMMDKPAYANFAGLMRFGGIVYRPKVYGKTRAGTFGINMARAKEFFAGQKEIPMQIVLNQITGEVVEVVATGKVGDFPQLYAFLKENGLYDYEMPIQEAMFRDSPPRADDWEPND